MQDTHNPTPAQRAWTLAASLLMCLGWLISIPVRPWPNLYHETWAAIAMALVLGRYLYSSKTTSIKLSSVSILCLFLLFIPGVQYGFGLVLWVGDAIVQTTYIGGLLLSIVVTQSLPPHQRDRLLLVLAMSLVLAASASVCIQLMQLSGIQVDWVRQDIDTSRPSANLLQPNHVGTLLLLGLAAAHHLFRQAWISRALLLLISALLSFGIAVSASRTAVLGTLVISALYWFAYRRGRPLHPQQDGYCFVLPLMMLACHLLVWFIWHDMPSGTVQHATGSAQLWRTDSNLRIESWVMFIHRILEAPWAGYGMGQAGMAHLLGTSHLHAFGSQFNSAHNIVLDTMLWMGLPLGGLMLLWAGYGVVKAMRISTHSQLFATAGMLVVLNHAMLEYPLSYSYFLLCFGVFVGANSPTFTTVQAHFHLSIRWLFVPLVALTLFAAKVALDHQKTGELLLRYGLHRQATSQPFDLSSADLGINAHWVKLMKYGMTNLHLQSTEVDLEEMHKTAVRFPTLFVVLNYAVQLQLRGQPDQAQTWLQRACVVNTRVNCDYLRSRWLALPPLVAGQANAAWPDTVFSVRTSTHPQKMN